MINTSRWHGIWSNKGGALDSNSGLAELIRADGFDSGAGDHTLDSWLEFTGSIYAELGLSADDNILEVGCGSGAFLYPAQQIGARVSGLDYSEGLIEGARKAIPAGDFAHGEADSLPFDSDAFDIVLSHSVFQYFTDDAYVSRVLDEMLRVLNPDKGRLAILDINDASKQSLFYQLRGESLDGEDYSERYKELPHRFYEKSWFEDELKQRGLEVVISDQDIGGYGNSAFRFNVIGRWPEDM